MNNKISLLVYNDSAKIGGHEIISIQGLEQLYAGGGIIFYFVISKKNTALISLIQNKFPNSEITQINYSSGRLQFIKTLFSIGTVLRVKNIINRINPKYILALQGSIEYGSICLVASKLTKNKTILISYIPITHDLSKVSRHKLVGLAKEFLNRFLFKIPDYYITINESLKTNLLQRCKKEIFIVKNGIDFSNLDNKLLTNENPFNPDKINILIIGRIEFNHKGQDLVLHMCRKYKDELLAKNVHFLILGSGSDSEKLVAWSNKYDPENNIIEFIPWTNTPQNYYFNSDIVLMPSRFEGTPLTILEAIYFHKIVIASNIEGISEILPSKYLFKSEDIDEMLKKIIDVVNNQKKYSTEDLREKILNEYSLAKFSQKFCSTIRFIFNK